MARRVAEVAFSATASLLETAPLREAFALVDKHSLEAVVVTGKDGTVRGVLLASEVRRLVHRLPELPLRLVPLLTTIELAPNLAVAEALVALSGSGADAAVVIREGGKHGVVMRDRLSEVA